MDKPTKEKPAALIPPGVARIAIYVFVGGLLGWCFALYLDPGTSWSHLLLCLALGTGASAERISDARMALEEAEGLVANTPPGAASEKVQRELAERLAAVRTATASVGKASEVLDLRDASVALAFRATTLGVAGEQVLEELRNFSPSRYARFQRLDPDVFERASDSTLLAQPQWTFIASRRLART